MRMHARLSRALLIQGGLALGMYGLMLVAAATFVQPLPDRVDAASIIDNSLPAPSLQRPEMSARRQSTETVTGTLVQSASELTLRLPSGAVYRLEEPSEAARSKAAEFAGKPVSVTGKVEEAARLIHVEKVNEYRG
jgi:Protein of unknown function (DUF5818)